jgi:hypothetical protein
MTASRGSESVHQVSVSLELMNYNVWPPLAEMAARFCLTRLPCQHPLLVMTTTLEKVKKAAASPSSIGRESRYHHIIISFRGEVRLSRLGPETMPK